MGNPKGASTKFLLTDETAFAQDPAAPDSKILYLRSCGVTGSREHEQDQTLRNDRVQGQPAQGNVNVSGPAAQSIDAVNIGFLLKHLLGAPVTTGAGPNYTHEFTPKALPVGFALERDHSATIAAAEKVERFQGDRIASARINIAQSGFPSIDWDIRGAKRSYVAAALDATPTDTGFVPFGAALATLNEGGAVMGKARSGFINIANSLDENDYVVGSGERGSLDEGFAVITGQLVMRFTDFAMQQKALDHTKSSLEYILKRGVGDGTVGNEYFGVKVENLVYKPTSAPVEGPGGIDQTLDFTGYLDGATSLAVTLKNQLASY